LGKADLHTHTRASDGWHTPEELVRMAREAGLEAVAVTDHDTVAGVQDALESGRKMGVDVLPGVEISTLHEGVEVHVLGYAMDFEDPVFLRWLQELRNTRDLRNRMIVERLQQLGIDIQLEEVYAKQQKDGNVGRPHIAAVLVEKGIVASVNEAFEEYLGTGKKAYVVPPRISPLEALELIHGAGGVCVLAHPGLYKKDDLLKKLIAKGLDGIEVFHPDHTAEDENRYRQMAEECGLLMTGGSDFHGVRDGQAFHGPLGSRGAETSVVERIREKARARKKG
jgi:predicted metal-dependent phosphoesterase TrpH